MSGGNVTEALFFTQVTTKQVEPVAASSKEQFKNILAKQTEIARKPETVKQEQKQVDENPMAKTMLSKKSDPVETTPATETTGEENTVDMEDLEEDIEALSADIMAFIAEAFGVDLKQVEAFAENQGIETNELLDMEILGEFTRQFAEVENPLELLTNEQAFQNFKDVMDFAQTGLENLSEKYAISAKEIEAVAIQNVVVKDSFETSVHVVGSMNDETESEILTDDVNLTSLTGMAESTEGSEGKVEKGFNEKDFAEGKPVIEVSQENQANRSSESMQQEGRGNTDNAFSRDTQERDAGAKAKSTIDMPYKDGPMAVHQNEPFLQFENIRTYAGRETPISTEAIMRQLMDYMKVSVKPDASDLEMQLHPQSLGNVQIHIANKEGTITAQFTTENEAVRATLEGQMIQLKERFEEQGIKVENIEVTVETHSFDQNLGQNQGRDEERFSGQQRRVSRSILNTSLSEEEMELLSDEDKLKLQMMESNGNQVDYKA